MRNQKRIINIIRLTIMLLLMVVSGCSAVGVPLTSDPAKKLSYAEALFDRDDRPLPAQTLIEDAIEIYKNRNERLLGDVNAFA